MTIRTAEIFSNQASEYAKFRPLYPEALYQYLASVTKEHDLVWDCGTGNGQAAVKLAQHYKKVFATDPSAKQLENAEKNPRVEYVAGRAEECALKDRTTDLVTVAQAFHWFDHPKFFSEVKRVLKPGGALAVWSYNLCQVDKAIDEIAYHYYEGILGPYWEPQRKLVEEGYAKCDFPFKELTPPAFSMTADWSVEQLIGYYSTWSSLQTYMKQKGDNPLLPIAEKLRAAWGSAKTRKVVWPLAVRVGLT